MNRNFAKQWTDLLRALNNPAVPRQDYLDSLMDMIEVLSERRDSAREDLRRIKSIRVG